MPKNWAYFKAAFLGHEIKAVSKKMQKEVVDIVHRNIFADAGARMARKYNLSERRRLKLERQEQKIREKYRRAYNIFLELVKTHGVQIEHPEGLALPDLAGEYRPNEKKIVLSPDSLASNQVVKENLRVLVHEFMHHLDAEERGKLNLQESGRNELVASATSYLFLSKLFKKDGFVSPSPDVEYAKKRGATEINLRELEEYILELYQKINYLYSSYRDTAE